MNPDEQVAECFNQTHITNCNGASPDCAIPDQDDLINFLNDPDTINKAVEGAMDKRLKVLADAELREAIAVNMGLYYRKSDDKWLREKHDNGRYLGVEDMTPELNSVVKIFQAREQHCDAVPDDQPNEVHIRFFNEGYKKGYIDGSLQNKTNDGGRNVA